MSKSKSKSKRTVWAMIGKILWAIVSLVLKVVARLGSRWARKKLDDHDRTHNGGTSGNRLQRALRPARR